jgi:hypothetical protein
MLEKFKQINSDLSKQIMSSDVLLSDCCLSDSSVKRSFIFNDPTYFPFYYYLGKYAEAKNLLVIGTDLGLTAACFLKSNPVKNILCFQEQSEEYYTFRMCSFNILKQCKTNLDFYYGDALDEEFQEKITSKKWDCVLISLDLSYDKLRNYFDIAWNNLVLNGTMVIESGFSKITERATEDFLKITQRDYLEFNTRYKAVLVTK